MAQDEAPSQFGADLFDHIRSFSVFAACSDEFIRAFASIAALRTCPVGCPILLEGQTNNKLFVLSSGRVNVVVEGESVAVLEQPGDLMGEISALNTRLASASLFALTPVEYLSIDVKDLDSHVQGSRGDFGYQLYRALGEVLSEKIVRTNEKARRFEMANRALTGAMKSLEEVNRTLDQRVRERTRDLQRKTEEIERSHQALEARNTELLASHRKLEELYSSKDMTFKTLNQLQTQCLSPLMETLRELEAIATPAAKERIETAKSQVANSVAMLRPMSELYSTEQAIRSRRVLLVESDRKQQVISKLALGGTGVRLEIASDKESALSHLRSGTRYDIIFVSSDLADLIPEARQSAPAAKFVFMASSNVPAELPSLKKYGEDIANIVSRHPEDRTFTVKNIATTVSKLASADLFGLEKYLNWGVEVQTRPVRSSTERKTLVDEMQEHFAQLGIRSSISDRAAVVAEELLMNAIYDAPVGPDGRARYNQRSRKETVELGQQEQAEFRYACDGMLAAISVSDPFGGFQMKTLLNYLERNYAPTQIEVQEEGKGGAGRGLHQIIENSDLVVFNVRRGLRTEVIALFNIDAKSVIEGAKPSFHFFLT